MGRFSEIAGGWRNLVDIGVGLLPGSRHQSTKQQLILVHCWTKVFRKFIQKTCSIRIIEIIRNLVSTNTTSNRLSFGLHSSFPFLHLLWQYHHLKASKPCLFLPFKFFSHFLPVHFLTHRRNVPYMEYHSGFDWLF